MKILFIVYGSIDSQSGGYLYDRMLIDALRSRGQDVKVISQPQRNCYLCNILDNLGSGFTKAAVDYAPDIVVEDELNHPSLFLLNRKLHALLRVPIVGMVHHLRQVEQNGMIVAIASRFMERAFLESLDGYICNSEFTRHSVLVALGKKPDDRLALPHVIALPGKDRLKEDLPSARDDAGTMPADADASNLARQPGKLRILFLGNVIRRKGLHVLVRALGMLSGKHGLESWSLSIAGNKQADPRYTSLVKKLIVKYGLDANSTWLGSLGDAALSEVFKTHDLLVVPSQCEGFGIVYAEAMKHGLPVIAGSYGGAAEMIMHGKNGYLVRWEDSETLAGLLAKLIEDPAMRQKLGGMAIARAAELPGWKESMSLAAAFLEGLA